jgi:hypothetical protein
LVRFPPFWYIASRKIWQPCAQSVLTFEVSFRTTANRLSKLIRVKFTTCDNEGRDENLTPSNLSPIRVTRLGELSTFWATFETVLATKNEPPKGFKSLSENTFCPFVLQTYVLYFFVAQKLFNFRHRTISFRGIKIKHEFMHFF